MHFISILILSNKLALIKGDAKDTFHNAKKSKLRGPPLVNKQITTIYKVSDKSHCFRFYCI